MCKGGGGSPPVPSGSSTAFQSTVTPNSFATPLYQDFLNRANTLSNTPFNPAMQGQVAPLNASQNVAMQDLFNKGLHMGDFDPGQVQSIMSPYIGNVVSATQNWFNNQNAIQGNDLMSQAIRSGNAFGGDRAGVAEGVLAGQQQLAQAPVIAGLYQSGYGQALDEYNRLKQFGITGAGAALGVGSMQQAQQQRELDVAQQNAMMSSAYPFQTLNWYGAILGGIAPLLGSQAVGYNTPPTPGGAGFRRGGMVLERRKQGGLVPVFVRHNGGIIAGLAYGGSADEDEDEKEKRPSSDSESRSDSGPSQELPEHERPSSWGSEIGQLRSSGRGAPTSPSFAGGTPQQPQSMMSQISEGVGTLGKIIDVGSKVAPFLAVMSDPKTKTDVQRVGKTDGGDPLYAFRYRGDPKTYPKVVGPMARPMGGTIPGIRRYADAGDVDEPLTMRDLGVLSDSGEELPRLVSGPARGSSGSNEGLTLDRETGRYSPVQQAEDQPNLARVRERFRPALESSPALARKFDATTTAEVGSRPEARAAYQALTMDRAAARGEPLGKTITDPNYYPASTLAARSTSGQGVSPSLWQGANPANFATGNASFDPKTGRWVGFAGGPQTGSVATGSGTETVGIEGPDLAAARRYGYMGPSKTAIGSRGPQGTGDETTPGEQGTPSRAAGPVTAGMGPVGGRIPGAPSSGASGVLGGITDIAKEGLRNPLVQLVGGYLSGTSPWGRVNLGRALLATGETQEKQRATDIAERRQNLLDTKPELIHTEKGMAYKYPDGTITHLGMKGADQALAERRLEAEEGRAKFQTFSTPFGNVTGVRQPDGRFIDTESGEVLYDPKNPTKGNAPQAQPPAAAPAAPVQPQPPATGVGNVRQTEAPPDRGGVGSDTAARAPIQVAQAPAPAPTTTGPDLTAGGQLPAETDQQREVAAEITGKGAKFKTPLKTDPRLLRSMGVTPEQFDGLALRLAHGDEGILKGMGNSKAAGLARSALRARANQFYTDQGLSEDEANKAISAFGAQKAGARSLAVQDARITGAIEQAKMVAPRVLEASARVDRTNYPNLNSVILAVQKGTGDTNVVQLNTAVHALVQNYAAAMGKGNSVLTDTATKRANELIALNFSDPQMRAAVSQMMLEMESESQGVKNAMKVYLGQGQGQGQGQPQQTQQPTTSPALSMPARVRQNGHTYERQPDGSYKAID